MPAKKLIHAVLTVYVCALLACCAGCTAAPAASPASTSGSSAAAEAPSPAADAAPTLADCPVSHSPNSDGVLIEAFLEEDGQTGIDVSHFEGLRNAGDVVAIDLDAAYLSERYGQKLAAGLGELMQHDGPVYIHCTAGKDRTGFVCMLLEALAGASYQQIADDYMITYDNYYHVNEANDAERFNIIKEQRLDSMLRHVIGAEIGADLANADLSAGARNYLKAAGMTDEQIDQLTAYLCA